MSVLRLSQASQRVFSRLWSDSYRSLSLITPKDFSSRRNVYKNEVTELRKQWAVEYKEKQQLAKEKKRQEVERIILQKAIRLRSKREDSASRIALKKYNNERIYYFHKEHLAKLKIIRAKKAAVQEKRFESLVRSLEAESKYWVTPENMDEKITEELFIKPCTTGVLNKDSENWRHYARCTNINRLLFGVIPEMKDEEAINDIILERTQGERATKEDIMGTLNSMIGTGEDREKFDELVDEFSSFAGNLGGKGRKPVNYNVKPDFDKMKREDFLNMFEKGENEYEDKMLRDKIDEMMGTNGDQKINASSNDDDDSENEDLNISENDYHMDDPSSPPAQPTPVPKVMEDMEEELFDDPVEYEYESAEPSMLDQFIEDLEYIDSNDEEALHDAYLKIKSKMLHR